MILHLGSLWVAKHFNKRITFIFIIQLVLC